MKIQCFPFYSLLLAANQTTIDFFSLDIEGHEKRVLETVPWEKVDIKVLLAAHVYLNENTIIILRHYNAIIDILNEGHAN